MNVVVDEATLREVYFWPFEVAASRGVWGMLTAYNRVNGIYCAEQHQAISQWLKRDLGWDGLVMSDWFGTQNGPASFRAGLDLEMPGPARHMGERLLPALMDTDSDARRLDDAAVRLARLAERVSHPLPGMALPPPRRSGVTPSKRRRRRGLSCCTIASGCCPRRAGGTAAGGDWPQRHDALLPGGTFARVALMPGLISPLEAIRQRFSAAGVEISYARGWRAITASRLCIICRCAPPPASAAGRCLRHRRRGVVHQEVRDASSLIWFRDMPGVGDMLRLTERATVTVSCQFTAPVSGRYGFWIGGTGRSPCS